MKIAYVTQQHDAVLPPRQNSLGLIIYNPALEVARAAQVTLYLRAGTESTLGDGSPLKIAYARSISDRLVQMLVRRCPRVLRPSRLEERADAFSGWASVVAEGLRRAPCLLYTSCV